MQVTHCGCKSINASCINKGPRPFRRTKGFFNFFVVDCFGMNIAAAAKIMRFAFYHSASKLCIGHHLFGGVDNFGIGSSVVSLAYIYMNKLKAGINTTLGILNRWAVVEVKIYF